MDPKLISADDRHRAPKGSFRPREFRRIVALSWPHRKPLVLGLLATVVFAGFHTLSVASVFPVFKILLEQEGLHGWVNRTVAGQRLDIEFAPVTDLSDAHLRVTKVAPDSDAFQQGRPSVSG